MSLGQKLKELREGAGLSQATVATEVGVTRTAVSQWEHDKFVPDRKNLAKLAKLLGVPPERLASPNTEVRERVLECATRMFDRVGIDETSIESICAAVDINKSEFDQAFGSKDDLIFEVLRGHAERTFAEIRRNPPKFGTLSARTKQLLWLYCVNDLTHPKLSGALHARSWMWDTTKEREHLRHMSEYHDTMYALLEEAEQQGQIDRGNFRAASNLILSSYTYLLRRALVEQLDPDKFMTLLEPHITLVLNGLGYRVVPGFADLPGDRKATSR